MSVQSAPFFWIECDHEGCTERTPEVDGEVVAWSQEEDATESALSSDWNVSRDGGWYCSEEGHCNNVCTECQQYDPTPLSGERDYLCVEHFAAQKESEGY